jgi:hypothetical protein
MPPLPRRILEKPLHITLSATNELARKKRKEEAIDMHKKMKGIQPDREARHDPSESTCTSSDDQGTSLESEDLGKSRSIITDLNSMIK